MSARPSTASSLRRAALALLAAVMALSVLVAVPATAQAPGGCDANGDGAAGGSIETIFSDGDDDVAAALEADTGVVLGPAEAAQRWRVEVCVEATADGARARSVLGPPWPSYPPKR